MGNSSASEIVKKVATTSPTTANSNRRSLENKKIGKMSSEEALAALIEAQMTRHQYNVVKLPAPDRFPCYSHVCLQGVHNNTVKRLVLLQIEVFYTIR